MRWLLICAVIGCGGASTPAVQPPAPVKPTARDEHVEVLTTGAQPRNPLRYRFTAGSQEDMDFEMTSVTSMTFDDATLGNRTQRTEVPTIRTRIRMEVASVDPDGAAHARFRYLSSKVSPDVKVDPTMRETLDNAMQQFVGVQGSMTLSTRGTSRDIGIQFTDTMTQPIRDTINQTMDAMKRMYIAFPPEPVGIGATWEIRARLPVMGATVDTEYRYTLVEATDAFIKLSVEMLQTAEPQTIQTGALKGSLESLTTKGHGVALIPLGKLVPTAKIDASTKMKLAIGSNADEIKVDATMDLEMVMRPVR